MVYIHNYMRRKYQTNMLQVTQSTNEKGNFIHDESVAAFRQHLRDTYGVSVSWNKKDGLGDEFNRTTSVASFEATITGARRHSSSIMANGIAKTVLTLDRDVLMSYVQDVDENDLPVDSYTKVASNELWVRDSDLERLFGLKEYNSLNFDELRLIDLKISFKAMIIATTKDERFNPSSEGFLCGGVLYLKSAGVRALPESVRLSHKMYDLYKREFSDMANRVATEQQRADNDADNASRQIAQKEKAARRAALLAAIAAENAKKGATEDKDKKNANANANTTETVEKKS
jgi:hypothetical protein